MKTNALKFMVILLIASMVVCTLSITMVSRAVTYEEITMESVAESTGKVTSATRILQIVFFTIQVVLIVIAITLVVKILTIIYFKIVVKQKSKKDISEDSTKEQQEEEEHTLGKIFRLIVVIIALLSICGMLNTMMHFAKPIIYIYPEENETKVSVTVSNPEKLTCTYPKYNYGWKVVADKDGTLTDESGRKYYALYWEGKDYKNSIIKEGFVVKGEDTAVFLEEKLAILGLNEREAEEFIVYWLPLLEKNNYNLIRFMTEDEINSQMELNIDPKPDTLIRIMMEYKPLMFKKEVKEQVLEKVERNGYTVVEWGGIKTK